MDVGTAPARPNVAAPRMGHARSRGPAARDDYRGGVQIVDRERYRDRWVAVDPADGTVVAESQSLDGLHALLDESPTTPVVIQRVPSFDDPMFVGLG